MARNTYLSTIESKKQSKQTRRTERIMDMESVLMFARGEGLCEMGEEERGLRSSSR